MLGADLPDLAVARGHWLRHDLIAWPADHPGGDAAGFDWLLHWSSAEPIDPREPEPVPWGTAVLTPDPAGLPQDVVATAPHLAGYLALRVPDEVPVADALTGQLAVSAHLPSGRLVATGSLQLPHVLDELYGAAARRTLGASWESGVPTLRVWAPTAVRVRLLLWDADLRAAGRIVPMERRPDGVWEVTGRSDWLGCRYRYEVTVYTPGYRRIVSNQVTDPYSVALTVNSTHSVLVDLDDPRLAPDAWLTTPSPVLEHRVDQVIYELHVRDFSISDKTVPAALRGSFLAFTQPSAGMEHLRRLAEAGMTTVQLLPVFDNASVEELPDAQEIARTDALKALPPDSDEQQRQVSRASQRPAYNWGYDPWHWLATEGSYASTVEAADGPGRVVEFRSLVGGLHAAGLRVVLDMVFNHTASAGQDARSVLDRIVPGYYHRLNRCGEVENSTCCANVATEHAMAEKLMVDACVLWARQYRVDGFRFDLMGHHSRDNLLAVRRALDSLTLARDGVDGASITLHGEGWSFGEVAGNARFVQASQGQLGGTGIATFSDRLRDAVRGGGTFESDPRGQGFGTGLVTDWNRVLPEQNLDAARLAYDTDLVQLGLAGTLRGYSFAATSRGRVIRGDELDYAGGPAGYADEPDEVISYVDAHDNETLFDALALKLPTATSMADRVRMNTVCLALATLGQSPVMWHAGTDMLRSKSLDRNSYSSGDWFNFLDFSLADNGFAAGLPPERDNGPAWHLLRPLLADPALKPRPDDIRHAHELALDLLRLRASTPLFRLRTAAAIQAAVSFPVSGTPEQHQGVIVMRIGECERERRWRSLVTVFNASPREVDQRVGFATDGFVLHPVQAGGADDVVRRCLVTADGFVVPGRTVAVFVRPVSG